MEIKNYTSWFCLFILFISFSSCKKETFITTTEKPVIQAYLIPGKQVLVKVNMQRGLLDTASYGSPISGLNISINDGSKTIALTETTKGQYIYSGLSFISTGKTYQMTFSYQDNEVSAQTTVPEKPRSLSISNNTIIIPIPDINTGTQDTFIKVNIKWENPELHTNLLVFKNDEKYPSGISYGGGPGGFGGSYRDIEINTGTSTSFEIDQRTFRYLGYYTLYLYTLNKEYIEILNASSRSSLNLTNPVTNVKNGLGIFTSMQADSLRLFVREK